MSIADKIRQSNDREKSYEERLEEFLFSNTDYDNETEEEMVNKILNTEFYKYESIFFTESRSEELAQKFDDEYGKYKGQSLHHRTVNGTKTIAKARAYVIKKYIDKTLNFKHDDLAVETFPRKLIRVAINFALIVGPWLLPIPIIAKLIVSVTGVFIANKVSINKKENLIDLYQTKIKAVEDKIDDCDNDKDKYEYEKLRKTMIREQNRLKQSLYGKGHMAYEAEHR